MSQQTIKQKARAAARDTLGKRRAERMAREKRIEDLVVVMMTALGERDAAVAEMERRAGAAVTELVEHEGLSMSEVGEWCDEQVSLRELTRMRRLAGGEQADEPGERSARTPEPVPAEVTAGAKSGGASASTAPE